MTLLKVSRWLRGFNASGELVAEYRLPDSWTPERLRELFGVVGEDPMFDSYAVGTLHAGVLGGAIGKDLASSDLEFFLEADAEE